jgi:hypothetical protein
MGGSIYMKKVLFGISLTAMLLLLVATATPSFATSLTPGGSVTPSVDGGGFTQLAYTGPMSFNFAGDTGRVQEWVGTVAGLSNPFPGGLTFIYQFTVTAGIIDSLSASSFGSFLTDVQYAGCGLAGCFGSGTLLPPNSVPPNATRSPDGTVVQFNWLNTPVGAGQTSVALEIFTNATAFYGGSIGLFDGGGATFSGFSPVPEPATLSLLGTGLLALAGGLRKKLFS